MTRPPGLSAERASAKELVRLGVVEMMEDAVRDDEVERGRAELVDVGPVDGPAEEGAAVTVARQVALRDEVALGGLDRQHVRRAALEHHADDTTGATADLRHSPSSEVGGR